MKKPKVVPLITDTYLAVIKNSVGTKMFRHFYAMIDGQKKEIMKNGNLSCAFYVSSVLALFKLIRESHGTVPGTVEDLRKSNWKQIKKPKVGSVLVWEKMNFAGDEPHKHIGFYVGPNLAISNSYKLGHPVKHHWTFKNSRKIEAIFWNQKLKPTSRS